MKRVFLCGMVALLLVATAGCGRNKVTQEPAGGFVHGYVRDANNGAPVDSAGVEISPTPPDTVGPPHAYSNSEGYYIFFSGFPHTDWYITAEREDYFPQTKMFSVASDETITVDFSLEPRGR